jgi:hypothetical protein
MVMQQVQVGLRRLPEDKAAEVLDFVEFLVRRYARAEDAARPGRDTQAAATDPKAALMEDLDALHPLYAEFAEEDRALARIGLAHYTRTLQQIGAHCQTSAWQR